MKRVIFISIILIISAIVFLSCEKEVSLTYDANGATGNVPSSITLKKSSSFTVADRGNLEKGAETFKNWNTKPDGSGNEFIEGKVYILSDDLCLYAYWVDERIGAPTNVRANKLSAISIQITWNAVVQAKSYIILRSDKSDGSFTQIGTSTATNTFFVDERLNMNTDYYYLVVGIDENNIKGKPSNVVKGTTK